ncbi:MAG: universal stress protein [Bacteroidales bacterium]|jgi:nucleotide-binding universal stress UspA family protein
MKTMKIKKVLIALDYNPTAQKIAEEGFSLAKAMGSEVILIHVMTDPIYYSSSEFSPIMGYTGYLDDGSMQLDSIDALKNAAQNFLDKTKQHLDDKTIQTQVKEGDFAESILKTAKELHADIIVMGSHSRRWLENIVMGSVTEEVLHHTNIPLFIIPTKKRD